jgi:hypothetical protein
MERHVFGSERAVLSAQPEGLGTTASYDSALKGPFRRNLRLNGPFRAERSTRLADPALRAGLTERPFQGRRHHYRLIDGNT